MVSTPATSRGIAPLTNLAVQSATGNVYGEAYDRVGTKLYVSAFAKRLSPYGPLGPGGIYVINNPTSGSPTTTAFATVPNAGASGHDLTLAVGHFDQVFFNVPGYQALGGMAISEDNKTLYVVNLNDNSLYSYSTSDTSGAASPLAVVPIPAPTGAAACAATNDWRPFSVTVHNAGLYVGGVCNAESTRNPADLKAVVYSVSGTTFTPIFSHALTDLRGDAAFALLHTNETINSHWNSWLPNDDSNFFDIEDMGAGGAGAAYEAPQPELTSIVFDRDGSLILGFRDRFGDQNGTVGSQTVRANNGVSYPDSNFSAGDLNRACANANGTYSWEGTNGCPNNATPANSGESGVVEYYPGEFSAAAIESSQGGVVLPLQKNLVVSTVLDPFPSLPGFAGGLGFFDDTTGLGPGNSNANGAQIYGQGEAGTFGKSNGLGAVTLLAARAPIQIGNRVWYDPDGDGRQDPGEVGIGGVTVNLFAGTAATGTALATTTTDADGEYYFGGAGAAVQLTPSTQYTVQFDACALNPATLPGVAGRGRLHPPACRHRQHDRLGRGRGERHGLPGHRPGDHARRDHGHRRPVLRRRARARPGPDRNRHRAAARNRRDPALQRGGGAGDRPAGSAQVHLLSENTSLTVSTLIP